jgi:hypothetical protein
MTFCLVFSLHDYRMLKMVFCFNWKFLVSFLTVCFCVHVEKSYAGSTKKTHLKVALGEKYKKHSSTARWTESAFFQQLKVCDPEGSPTFSIYFSLITTKTTCKMRTYKIALNFLERSFEQIRAIKMLLIVLWHSHCRMHIKYSIVSHSKHFFLLWSFKEAFTAHLSFSSYIRREKNIVKFTKGRKGVKTLYFW